MRSHSSVIELCIWLAALILLAFTDPVSHPHFGLCPLAGIGINWCPGCGLGRSVIFILHGNLATSLQQHWFGVPALLILVNRIVQIIRKFMLPLSIP